MYMSGVHVWRALCGYLCLENWNRELMSRAIKRRLYTISSIWRDCESDSDSESESSCTTLAASSLRLRCSMRVRSAMRAIRSRSVRLRLRACSSSLRCCICSSDLPAWNARAMYTGIPGYLLRMYSTPLPARLSSGVMTGYPKRGGGGALLLLLLLLLSPSESPFSRGGGRCGGAGSGFSCMDCTDEVLLIEELESESLITSVISLNMGCAHFFNTLQKYD